MPTLLGESHVTYYGNNERLQVQKGYIADELRKAGFLDVQVRPNEIAGHKDGCWFSILHLHQNGNYWWEVIHVACDGYNVALAEKVRTQAYVAIKR